ncbi:MAG: S8 family peptidase [Chitinophagaceae bacterium]|nr:MAG: S8 family peptidase [Chitinophagaceae bacterium]
MRLIFRTTSKFVRGPKPFTPINNINYAKGVAVISFAALLFVGCRKSTDSASTTTEVCIVGNGIRNGVLIDSQYIVLYKSSDGTSNTVVETEANLSTDVRLNAMLKRNGLTTSRILSRFNGGRGGFIARISKQDARNIARDPLVETVEQDRIIALGSCFSVAAPTLLTWNIKKTGYGDGTGKTAWVIDTGIESTHPDLNVDISRSRSFITGDASFEDKNGHGTHVAGIIGAKNNLFGVLGVASNASLVALKVLNGEGEGTLGGIIKALAYVNANAKAGDVVNISLGEEEASDVFDSQVKQTAAKGIFITIAAGNDGKPATDFSPARANAPNIYTVSAIDSLNNFASFSNYGNDAVDFAAPGVHILSTYTNKRYAYLSGTSMAAPHVAGLLLLSGTKIQIAGYAKNDPDGNPDPISMK